MSPKSWEEQLTDAYWDYRWRKIMEPLCDTFQGWKAGKLGHSDVDKAIDKAYKEKKHLQLIFLDRGVPGIKIIHLYPKSKLLPDATLF